MKKFVVRVTLVGLFFYGLLSLVQLFFDSYLKNSNDFDHKIWNEVATGKAASDYVFLGSSRALVHYDPQIIEEGLNKSSYVLGLNATGYDLQEVMRELYFNNNEAPEILFQNVDVTSFRKTKQFFKKPYLPYYSLNTVGILKNFDDDVIPEYLIPMYKYRGYLFEMEKLVEKSNIKVSKGYIEMDLNWDGNLEKLENRAVNGKLDLNDVDFDKGFIEMENLIEETRDKNTKLVFLWAPEYYKRIPFEEPHYSRLVENFRSLERNNENVYFIDFSLDSLSYNHEYFYNTFHLNKEGVAIYNKKLIDSIQQKIYNNKNID
jgi:hypothetical protein